MIFENSGYLRLVSDLIETKLMAHDRLQKVGNEGVMFASFEKGVGSVTALAA